jgi:hypothetical protein
LPPFELVRADRADYGVMRRVRLAIAISPEDLDQAPRVARKVMALYEDDNDVAQLYFYPSAEAADRAAERAFIVGQYVRRDFRSPFRPEPLTSHTGTVEIATQHGVLIVERQATGD